MVAHYLGASRPIGWLSAGGPLGRASCQDELRRYGFQQLSAAQALRLAEIRLAVAVEVPVVPWFGRDDPGSVLLVPYEFTNNLPHGHIIASIS